MCRRAIDQGMDQCELLGQNQKHGQHTLALHVIQVAAGGAARRLSATHPHQLACSPHTVWPLCHSVCENAHVKAG